MKKLFSLVITFACIFVVSAGAQSLADIAAQTRAKQKAHPNVKVIDNDILPSVSEDSSDAASSDKKKDEATAKKESAKNDDKDKDKKDEAKKDDGKAATADDDQKVSDSLKKKIEDQQKEVTQLQRELDVSQREARLRAAAYYADAGTMLRDQGKFAEDSRNIQAEIDTKTHALADAKQKLEDLQEQARRSGAPSKEVESPQ